MQTFTTRPELTGTFGMATSTHWLASAVGMKLLEAGGNAFDAAAGMGLVLQIVEPHLNGPGGDLPAVMRIAASDRIEVLCGQGVAPAGATIEHYKGEGLDIVPGSGLLATVVPGSFGGWMRMIRDHGSLPLRAIMEPAIFYAEHGHPLLHSASQAIEGHRDFFQKRWPDTAAVWLPGGSVPAPNSLVRLPALADTWKRVLREAESRSGREAQIEAATAAFYSGFVAEAIDRYCRDTEIVDHEERAHRAVLTGQDLADWSASIEAPVSLAYHGWEVFKTGPWGQGPMLLQSLALLKGRDLAALDPSGGEFVHVVTEALKLAFADREAYYGDPDHVDVPMSTLLSEPYNAARRGLIAEAASRDLLPGAVPGFERQVADTLAHVASVGSASKAIYEPTMDHLNDERGDTVHLDVIDRWGNVVSATPSGGWLQSSPVIPELGFCLNTRAQMFWLQSGLASSLAPGRRPRTTLTPSIATHEDGRILAFGTPGGDMQDQWQLAFFLRHVHHGLNLQEAIDLPLFHTNHAPSSFDPRLSTPAHLMAEASFGEDALEDLRRRGHDLTVVAPWTVGRVTAALREPQGLLRAAATPRLMQAYAAGR